MVRNVHFENHYAVFDGSNDFISVADDSSLHLDSFTLAAWINTNTRTFSDIILKQQAFNENYLQLSVWGPPESPLYSGLAYGSVVGGSSSEIGQDWSLNPVNDGYWHHLAFVRDTSAGEVRI